MALYGCPDGVNPRPGGVAGRVHGLCGYPGPLAFSSVCNLQTVATAPADTTRPAGPLSGSGHKVRHSGRQWGLSCRVRTSDEDPS